MSGRSIARAVAATGLCTAGTRGLVMVSMDTTFRTAAVGGQVNGPLISSSMAQPSGPIFSFHSL